MFRDQYHNDVTSWPPQGRLHQTKIINIDYHMGLSNSGLAVDVTILRRYMSTECLCYIYSLNTHMPLNRLISLFGNKMQLCRSLCVGHLVTGFDENSAYYDYNAKSIRARS